jgi:hypothetical protein
MVRPSLSAIERSFLRAEERKTPPVMASTAEVIRKESQSGMKSVSTAATVKASMRTATCKRTLPAPRNPAAGPAFLACCRSSRRAVSISACNSRRPSASTRLDSSKNSWTSLPVGASESPSPARFRTSVCIAATP